MRDGCPVHPFTRLLTSVRDQSSHRILWVMTDASMARLAAHTALALATRSFQVTPVHVLGAPRDSAGPRAGINRLSKGAGPCSRCLDGILVALRTGQRGLGGVGRARARPQGTALGKARPRVHPCVLDSGPGQAPVLPHAATLVTLFPMMEDTLSSRAGYLLFSVQPQCARRGPSS